MTFELGAATISIGAQNNLKSGLAQAKSQVEGMGSSFGGALTKVAAMVGIFALLKKSIESFFEAEKGLASLTAAIQASGQAVDQVLPKFRDFANKVALATHLDDDAALALLRQATAYGLMGKQAEEAVRLAIGLSAKFGISTEEAMTMAAKATQGQFRALGQLIPQIKGVKDQQEAMNILNKAASEGLEQEAGMLHTTAGSWGKMMDALGDAGKAIGELIAGQGGDFLAWLTSWIRQFEEGIRIIIAWKNEMVASYNSASESTMSFFGVVKAVFNGIVTQIKMVIYTISNLGLVWDVVAEAVGNAFNYIFGYLSTFGGNVIKVGKFIWDNWKEIFTDIGNMTMTIFGNVAGNIKEVVSKAWEFIKSGGTSGFDVNLKGITDGFKSSIKNDLKLDEFQAPKAKTEAADTFAKGWENYIKDGEAAGKQVAKAQKDAEAEITGKKTDLKLDPDRKNKGDKDKDKAGTFKGLVDAWKDMQTKLLKEQDDLPKKHLAAVQQGNQIQQGVLNAVNKIAAMNGGLA